METINSIFDSIFSFGADIFTTFIISGFIGSMVALFVSTYIIRRISRAGVFDRPLKLWTWIVCINKVYLPVVMMVLVGTLSGIYGVNNSVNEFVEEKVEMTLNSVDLSQLNVSNFAAHMKEQKTMEEMIVGQLSNKGHGDHHSNTIVAKTLMSELGYPSEIDELAMRLRSADWKQINKGISFGVGYVAAEYIDGIFWLAYRVVFMFILVACLKLPLLELLVFYLYRKIAGSMNSVKRGNFDSVQIS